jgi:putative transposase
MARRLRIAPGGIAYHAMNRAAGRGKIFYDDGDYEAFEHVLAEARERQAMRVCAYAVMPNHFHLVLWPRKDGDLSAFMKWLTLTHSQRWHAFRHKTGSGALYQGRFRSFPVREDEHFLKVCRYVERNPLRAKLVERAQEWAWSSLGRRGSPEAADLLDEWPVPRPSDWTRRVNAAETQDELAALRLSIKRGRPFGPEPWAARVADRLGLAATLRPLGRPAADRGR